PNPSHGPLVPPLPCLALLLLRLLALLHFVAERLHRVPVLVLERRDLLLHLVGELLRLGRLPGEPLPCRNSRLLARGRLLALRGGRLVVRADLVLLLGDAL